jgi:hypothetical protein
VLIALLMEEDQEKALENKIAYQKKTIATHT